MKEPTAKELYEARSKEIDLSLKRIKTILKEHKKEFLTDTKDYGYSGDLGSVLSHLNEIMDFFQDFHN